MTPVSQPLTRTELWCPTCSLVYDVGAMVMDSFTWKCDIWPTGVLKAPCPRCPDRLLLPVWLLEDGVYAA